MRLITVTSLALALVASSMPTSKPNDLTRNLKSRLPATVPSNTNLQRSTGNLYDELSNPDVGRQLGGFSGSAAGSGIGSAGLEHIGGSGIAAGSGLAGTKPPLPRSAQPINGVELVGRRAVAPVSVSGLSGAVSGMGSQTESAAGGPVSGTNSGEAAGLLHGASNAGGTSGKGNFGDVGSVTGTIPGASGAGNGMVSGSGTYLNSAANGGASGAGSGIIGGGLTGAAGPVSGAVSGTAEGSPSFHA
ncbi:hypothetical protein BS17DRAFT_777639 [Gyrodon lividus]|nr:hypothetical protein BS17DRAFT_777639 [Gyrodon lividus]